MHWVSVQNLGKVIPPGYTQGRCLQLGLRSEGNQAHSGHLSTLFASTDHFFSFVDSLDKVSKSSQMLYLQFTHGLERDRS